jgi:hypothetical protein
MVTESAPVAFGAHQFGPTSSAVKAITDGWRFLPNAEIAES